MPLRHRVRETAAMHLIRFDDPVAFLARTAPFLEQREAENGMLLSLAMELANGGGGGGGGTAPAAEPPLLWTVEESSRVVAAVFRAPPRRPLLMLTAAQPLAVALVADALARQRVRPTSFLAPAETARLFALAWSKLSPQRVRAHVRMRIYEARHVIPPTSVPGTLREATPADVDMLAGWTAQFHKEIGAGHGGGGGGDLPDPRAQVEAQVAEGRLFVWKTAAGPVSMAAWAGPTTHGIRVNCVFTPPEHRCRGYASAAVATLTQRLLDSGRTFVFLYADLANATSNNIYPRIGYVPVADAHRYSLTDR